MTVTRTDSATGTVTEHRIDLAKACREWHARYDKARAMFDAIPEDATVQEHARLRAEAVAVLESTGALFDAIVSTSPVTIEEFQVQLGVVRAGLEFDHEPMADCEDGWIKGAWQVLGYAAALRACPPIPPAA